MLNIILVALTNPIEVTFTNATFFIDELSRYNRMKTVLADTIVINGFKSSEGVVLKYCIIVAEVELLRCGFIRLNEKELALKMQSPRGRDPREMKEATQVEGVL